MLYHAEYSVVLDTKVFNHAKDPIQCNLVRFISEYNQYDMIFCQGSSLYTRQLSCGAMDPVPAMAGLPFKSAAL